MLRQKNKMKLKVLDIAKTEIGTIELPFQFYEEIRPLVIKRAFQAIMGNKRQSYGAEPSAGKKASARLSKRRRDYRTSYGRGMSRAPRKVMSRRGTQFNYTGAFAPGTVGGRKAHPPKAEKIWKKKINIKERRKAIRSAISATMIAELVRAKGHMLPVGYPFVVDDRIMQLSKTKEARDTFSRLGLDAELERAREKKIRPGKGKNRGRKYRKKKSLLVVVPDKCTLQNAARNIPGINIAVVKSLNVELLAPGGIPGRLTLWTRSAIERMSKEALFR